MPAPAVLLAPLLLAVPAVLPSAVSLTALVTAQSAGAGHLRKSQESHLREAMRGFGDPEAANRRKAIAAVSGAGQAVVGLVVERARETSNPLVVRSALLTLEEIGGVTAAEQVRALFLDSQLKEDERVVAALVLGILGPGDAVDKLRLASASRRPSLMRRSATLALGRCGDVEGIRQLLEVRRRDPLPRQRAAMMVAAGVVRNRALLPRLVIGLEDEAALVRRAAALAIGSLGESAVLADLLTVARREKDESVQVALSLALGVFDDEASLDVLQKWVRSRDEALRHAAVGAVASRTDSQALVRRLLEDVRDTALVEQVALACAACRGTPPTQELTRLLTSSSANVRSAAGLALAALGARGASASSSTEKELVAWLRRERSPAARADALLAVGSLDLRNALDALDAGEWSDGPQSRRDDELLENVRRTLAGRRDVRLLRDDLEERLRERVARLDDLFATELQNLVDRILELDNITRRHTGDAGDGGGPRLDVRNAAAERDLVEWFGAEPYFPRDNG